MMRTVSTVPACWNSSRRSSSVAWKERLPTNSFAAIAILLPSMQAAPVGHPAASIGAPSLVTGGNACQGPVRGAMARAPRPRRGASEPFRSALEVDAARGPSVDGDADARDEGRALRDEL